MVEESTERRRVVLIVDDEALIRNALQRLLRREPYDVIFAESSQQVYEQLGARTIDMIISDYRMPGMNGVELLASVRKQFPHVLRVLLTGSLGQHDVARAKQSGDVEAFLQKPWDNASLLEELRRLLAGKAGGTG